LDPKVFLPVKRALGSFFMKKIFLFIISILFFLNVSKDVNATFVAGTSAGINYTSSEVKGNKKQDELMLKKMVIKKILDKYDSPLVNDVDSFISTCYKYDLNCFLLPSISAVESTFGKFSYSESHNPFGWGAGKIFFDSYALAIETVGKGLRKDYIDKGAETIDDIGVIYCEGNTWASKVKYFMNLFLKEEENQLILKSYTVEL